MDLFTRLARRAMAEVEGVALPYLGSRFSPSELFEVAPGDLSQGLAGSDEAVLRGDENLIDSASQRVVEPPGGGRPASQGREDGEDLDRLAAPFPIWAERARELAVDGHLGAVFHEVTGRRPRIGPLRENATASLRSCDGDV